MRCSQIRSVIFFFSLSLLFSLHSRGGVTNSWRPGMIYGALSPTLTLACAVHRTEKKLSHDHRDLFCLLTRRFATKSFFLCSEFFSAHKHERTKKSSSGDLIQFRKKKTKIVVLQYGFLHDRISWADCLHFFFFSLQRDVAQHDVHGFFLSFPQCVFYQRVFRFCIARSFHYSLCSANVDRSGACI